MVTRADSILGRLADRAGNPLARVKGDPLGRWGVEFIAPRAILAKNHLAPDGAMGTAGLWLMSKTCPS
jgi:hypothetical protein